MTVQLTSRPYQIRPLCFVRRRNEWANTHSLPGCHFVLPRGKWSCLPACSGSRQASARACCGRADGRREVSQWEAKVSCVAVRGRAYLLLSVRQLVAHEQNQLGERRPLARLQGPTISHDLVPTGEGHAPGWFQCSLENCVMLCRNSSWSYSGAVVHFFRCVSCGLLLKCKKVLKFGL